MSLKDTIERYQARRQQDQARRQQEIEDARNALKAERATQKAGELPTIPWSVSEKDMIPSTVTVVVHGIPQTISNIDDLHDKARQGAELHKLRLQREELAAVQAKAEGEFKENLLRVREEQINVQGAMLTDLMEGTLEEAVKNVVELRAIHNGAKQIGVENGLLGATKSKDLLKSVIEKVTNSTLFG